jgi:hypothetical protein
MRGLAGRARAVTAVVAPVAAAGVRISGSYPASRPRSTSAESSSITCGLAGVQSRDSHDQPLWIVMACTHPVFPASRGWVLQSNKDRCQASTTMRCATPRLCLRCLALLLLALLLPRRPAHSATGGRAQRPPPSLNTTETYGDAVACTLGEARGFTGRQSTHRMTECSDPCIPLCTAYPIYPPLGHGMPRSPSSRLAPPACLRTRVRSRP